MFLLSFNAIFSLVFAMTAWALGAALLLRCPVTRLRAIYAAVLCALGFWAFLVRVPDVRYQVFPSVGHVLFVFFGVSVCAAPMLALSVSSMALDRHWRMSRVFGGVLSVLATSFFLWGVMHVPSLTVLQQLPLLWHALLIPLGCSATLVFLQGVWVLRNIERADATHQVSLLSVLVSLIFLVAVLALVGNALFLFMGLSLLCVAACIFAMRSPRLLYTDISSTELFAFSLGLWVAVIILRAQQAVDVLVGLVGGATCIFFGLRFSRSSGRVNADSRHADRELRMLEEAREDYVALVAHQLRTPLTGIRSSSAMLKSGDYGTLPPKARSVIQLIENTSVRLLSLADTFLHVERVHVGGYRSERISTDIRHEIMRIVEEFRIFGNMRHVKLVTQIDASVSRPRAIDVEVLRHTVSNLLDNALKYTEKGTVTITARILDQGCLLEVRDTGVGMTQAELHQLFQKFQRGAKRTSHATDGTGLGLYFVRRLVDAAGGTVTAQSNGARAGTTFMVQLPIDPVDDSSATQVR